MRQRRSPVTAGRSVRSVRCRQRGDLCLEFGCSQLLSMFIRSLTDASLQCIPLLFGSTLLLSCEFVGPTHQCALRSSRGGGYTPPFSIRSDRFRLVIIGIRAREWRRLALIALRRAHGVCMGSQARVARRPHRVTLDLALFALLSAPPALWHLDAERGVLGETDHERL